MTPDPILDLDPGTIRSLRVVGAVVGVCVAAFSFFGRRTGLLDYRPGGTALGEDILPVLAIGMALSVILAFRWEVVGGALAAFTGAALVAFAFNQLVPLHAWLMTLAFVVPALVWIVIDLAELTPRWAVAGVAVAGLLAAAGGAVGHGVYDAIWGPTHPGSAVAELPDSPIRWVWTGAVTPNEAEVRALARDPEQVVRLQLATSADFDQVEVFDADDRFGSIAGFRLDGLEPSTEYHYRLEVAGTVDSIRTGRFTTFPDGPASFTIAIGACARVGSNGAVFDTIREMDPLLYLSVGDLHYGDNNQDDIERFREVMDLTLALPAQSALYRSTPIAYVWDDHDYAGNDSGGNAQARAAAMAAYREYVPSYPLADADSAVYQAFTVGRVRIIMTDARSERDLDPLPGSDQMSMLGTRQREWLERELVESSQSHALVLWVNPVPWVTDAEDGADHWGGYADERRLLADHLAEHDIDNLAMVSGDAHMVAIDDGTNTDFSSSQTGGFPLIHAAPLDRPGSIKGGPYSHGAVAEGGQFATLDVHDDGTEISLVMSGFDWNAEQIMTFEFRPPSLG